MFQAGSLLSQLTVVASCYCSACYRKTSKSIKLAGFFLGIYKFTGCLNLKYSQMKGKRIPVFCEMQKLNTGTSRPAKHQTWWSNEKCTRCRLVPFLLSVGIFTTQEGVSDSKAQVKNHPDFVGLLDLWADSHFPADRWGREGFPLLSLVVLALLLSFSHPHIFNWQGRTLPGKHINLLWTQSSFC